MLHVPVASDGLSRGPFGGMVVGNQGEAAQSRVSRPADHGGSIFSVAVLFCLRSLNTNVRSCNSLHRLNLLFFFSLFVLH